MPSVAVYEKIAPIVEQKQSEHEIATALLSVWVLARTDIMQMSAAIVPTASDEELGLILKLMRQYGTITPVEFGECIRKAAHNKCELLANGKVNFPVLYAVDIEFQIKKLTLQKLKEPPKTMQLPERTGGNQYTGKPSEALAREWPAIYEMTLGLRKTIKPDIRYTFWRMGKADERASAKAMLGAMVDEMTAAQFWDKGQIDRNVLAIFEKEYNRDFPDFHKFIDTTIQCPLTVAQWEDLRAKTLRRCATMAANGANAPDISLFPDGTDCYYLAIFDAYWKFWESQAQ